jgi:hypothetical protein
LLRACSCLHDASFDLSKFAVDIEKGLWRGLFEQGDIDDPSLTIEPKGLIFEKWTYPVVTIELALKGVTKYTIEDQSDIGVYSFNKCRIKGGEYVLEFNERMQMVLEFTGKPEGALRNLGSLGKRRCHSLYNFRKFKKNAGTI